VSGPAHTPRRLAAGFFRGAAARPRAPPSTTYKVLRRFEDPAQDPPSLEDTRPAELAGPARQRKPPKKSAPPLQVVSGSGS
jgi:hypothetical protein